MRKITSLLVLFCMCVATAWAQSSLRISEGLLTTQDGSTAQYTWTSNELTKPAEGEFNKLRITFMTTSNNEKPAGFPCVAIAEFYLYDANGDRVGLTEANFSSNATQGGEGNIASLCDGFTVQQDGQDQYQWYWHSRWAGDSDPYGYHYLEINLTDLPATTDLSTYKIGWVTRRAQASPREVIISTGATTNEAAMNANREMLPEVSTEAVRLYTIKSVRSKKFLAYDESQAKPQQIATANNNCYWYFTNGADGKVVMHNLASGKVLGTEFEMATSGEWFVSPAVYRPGVVFSKTDNVRDQSSCIDDQSGSIGPWGHNDGDNEGTTWLVEEVTNIDVPVLSLNGMKISSIGDAVTELVLDKWYILNNVGRGNYVSQELNNWKMRATDSVAVENLATEKAGYLFKITKNGEYYNIMSGNGKYFQLGSNTASTSATPVNYEIGKIGESANNFYLFDKDHRYAADGQETGYNFVGWSTSHPTSAGGNDSYRLLPVELFDLVGALKTELANALADAKTMYANLPKGEGVGKYTAPADIESQFGALEDFCEGINNNTSIAEINDKIAELEALKASVTLNMPVAGKFYRMHNDNKYITSGVTDGRIALSEDYDNAASVYYYDGTHLLAFSTGLYIGLNANDWTFEAVGSNDISAIEFVAAVNGAVAKYNIKSADRWLHRTDAFVNRCTDNTCGNPHNWTIEEVTWLPIPMNTTAGYATLISPVALSTYDWKSTTVHRVEAYVGKIEGDNFKMTRIDEEDGVIPANTPVVLKYVKGYEESKKAVFLEISSSNKEAVAEENNDLRGTFADTYVTTEAYALGLVDGEVGFYTAKMTDGQWLNNGFKAYLPMPAGSNVQALRFNFDGETTAIDAVEVENANAPIYDLSGRRVLSTVKGGIYIQNGKKFIVK